jgi:hypothetical protein
MWWGVRDVRGVPRELANICRCADILQMSIFILSHLQIRLSKTTLELGVFLFSHLLHVGSKCLSLRVSLFDVRLVFSLVRLDIFLPFHVFLFHGIFHVFFQNQQFLLEFLPLGNQLGLQGFARVCVEQTQPLVD